MSKHYNLTVTDDNGKSVTTSNTSTEHPEEVLRMMHLAGMQSQSDCGESIEEETEYKPTPANDKLDLDDYSKKSPESIAKQKKSLDKAPSRGDNPLEYSLDESEIYEALMDNFIEDEIKETTEEKVEEVEEGKLNPGLQAYLDKKKEKATPVDDDDPKYADDDNLDKNKKKKKESVEEAGPNYPGEYDYMDPKYMNQDGSSTVESDAVKAIMDKHPQDVSKMMASGDLDSGSELYMDLYNYYLDSGDMPYGTAKARDGDPVEWIMGRLDDMGLTMESQEEGDMDENAELNRLRKLANLPQVDSEESEKVDEVLPLAPLAGMAAKAVIGGAVKKLAKKAIGGAVNTVKNQVGNATGNRNQ